MRRQRTTAISLFFTGLAAAALTASASGNQAAAVPRLVFPLVAKTDLWDNYGDPRGNGSHAGIDLINPWRAPTVATEDGTPAVRPAHRIVATRLEVRESCGARVSRSS